MGTAVTIEIQGQRFPAELNASPAGAELLQLLPLELRMSRWGEEYYGSCGLDMQLDSSARELMEVGEIAFWPAGRALCFFFGPTPASSDERPRAASPVLPLGRFSGGVEGLKAFGSSIQAEIRRQTER